MRPIDSQETQETDAPIEHQPGVAGWDDESLPSRPRRTLMTPARGVLLALLLGVAGFLAGVEVEKGQMTSSAPSTRGGRAAGNGGAAAFLAAQGGATIGSVSTVQGPSLFVTDLNGNTIKILTNAGSQVSETVAATVHAIHPGDTVVVSGAKTPDGSVTATQIRLSQAGGGAGSSGGLSSLFGGGGGSGGGAGGAGGGGAGGSLRGRFGG